MPPPVTPDETPIATKIEADFPPEEAASPTEPCPKSTTAGPPGKGYHKETFSGKAVKQANVTAEQDAFLGPGPHTSVHPRTGEIDDTRRVSADGKRSIRYGDHEKLSEGTTKHHYHEETWTHDPDANVMNVDNVVRRIQAPPKPKPTK